MRPRLTKSAPTSLEDDPLASGDAPRRLPSTRAWRLLAAPGAQGAVCVALTPHEGEVRGELMIQALRSGSAIGTVTQRVEVLGAMKSLHEVRLPRFELVEGEAFRHTFTLPLPNGPPTHTGARTRVAHDVCITWSGVALPTIVEPYGVLAGPKVHERALRSLGDVNHPLGPPESSVVGWLIAIPFLFLPIPASPFLALFVYSNWQQAQAGQRLLDEIGCTSIAIGRRPLSPKARLGGLPAAHISLEQARFVIETGERVHIVVKVKQALSASITAATATLVCTEKDSGEDAPPPAELHHATVALTLDEASSDAKTASFVGDIDVPFDAPPSFRSAWHTLWWEARVALVSRTRHASSVIALLAVPPAHPATPWPTSALPPPNTGVCPVCVGFLSATSRDDVTRCSRCNGEAWRTSATEAFIEHDLGTSIAALREAPAIEDVVRTCPICAKPMTMLDGPHQPIALCWSYGASWHPNGERS